MKQIIGGIILLAIFTACAVVWLGDVGSQEERRSDFYHTFG